MVDWPGPNTLLRWLEPLVSRVGKMPAFMSKCHATDIYWHFPELSGIFWHFPNKNSLQVNTLIW